jgi:MHS family proline/betaine transporter-like MFS transporter
LLLGSLTGAILTGLLPAEELADWGWRVPFLLGLAIGPIGFWLRRNMAESPSFLAQSTPPKSPLADIFRNHARQVIAAFAVTIAWTVCTYCFLIYMPTYAVRQLHLPQSSSLFANSIGLVAATFLAPVFGAWSDRVGRRVPMLIATFAMVVLTYPLFLWITSDPSFVSLAIVQFIFGTLTAMYTGPAPTMISELFPTSVRSTGLSLAYNFAVTIFWRFRTVYSDIAHRVVRQQSSPTHYVIAANLISLLAVAFLVTGSRRTRYAA